MVRLHANFNRTALNNYYGNFALGRSTCHISYINEINIYTGGKQQTLRKTPNVMNNISINMVIYGVSSLWGVLGYNFSVHV